MNDTLNIVVSMTILPSRIGELKTVLNSLRNQDLALPYLVKIYIPKNPIRDRSLKVLPEFLQDTSWFDNYCTGQLEYAFVEDIGPITKIIPALLEFPNHIVVTCDDDGYYPRQWLSGLINNFDGTEVVAYRGRKFVNASIRYGNTDIYECHKITRSYYADIVTGTWGAVYMKHFFDDDFFDEYNKFSFWNRIDDIWISGHLWKNQVKIKILPNINPIDTADSSVLNSRWEINEVSSFNDQGILHFKNYLAGNRTRHFSLANIKMRLMRPIKNFVKGIPELAQAYEFMYRPQLRFLAS